MGVQEYVAATSQPLGTGLRVVEVSGALFESKALSFTMQAQTQSNWCWAATSTSVSRYYWFLSRWTQCRVANAELTLTGCCGTPVPTPCNVPWYLDRALTRTGNFVRITGPASVAAVRAEIDANRPVGARIGWSGGGGHFMCIYGYTRIGSLDYFDIDDPIYGKSHLPVSTFSNKYQGSGTWTHTYFTKRSFTVPIIPIPLDDQVHDQISRVRPMLGLKSDVRATTSRSSAPDAEPALGLAQRVFVVGLDDLIDDGDVTGRPVGLRVYETVDDVPRAFYDLAEDGDRQVQQVSESPSHLEPFGRALPVALDLADRMDRDGTDERAAELRLFRAPALNVEALWLHYPGGDGDQLIPLTAVGPLPVGEPVPFADAVPGLRQAAQALRGMDDTMGA